MGRGSIKSRQWPLLVCLQQLCNQKLKASKTYKWHSTCVESLPLPLHMLRGRQRGRSRQGLLACFSQLQMNLLKHMKLILGLHL